MWSYLQILNKDSQGIRWYEDENKSCGQLSDLECFTLSTYKITSLLGAICLGFEVLFDLLHYKDRIGEEIIWYILYIIIFLIHFQFDTFLAKPMEFVTVIFVVILLIFSYPIYGCIYYSDNKRIAQKREERRLTRVRLGYEAPRPGEENIPEFRPNIMNVEPIEDNHLNRSRTAAINHPQREVSMTMQENTKMCMICLSDFVRGERISQLKCHSTHIFHSECINAWQLRNNECPLCREVRPQVEVKSYKGTCVQPEL